MIDRLKKLPTRILGLSIVAVAMIAMLIFSWRCWPDPIADFGRELYVPWQLSQEKALYGDVAYFNGPLSPEFNATLFRMFGAHLMTLAWANIVILCVIVLMLHRIAARISDEFTATVATLAFVLLLAIGQPGPAANYNFITPYSHEMTHGFALALCAILCVMNYTKSKRTIWAVLGGLALGFAFLTKPEIFLAGAIACAAGCIISRSTRREYLVLTGTTLIAPLIALFTFGSAALGAWRWVFDSALVEQHFYRFIRGTDDIGHSLGLIAGIGAGYVLVLGVPILAAISWRPKRPALIAGAMFAVVAIVLSALHDWVDWAEIGRPLVLVTVIVLAVLLIQTPKPQAAGAELSRASRVMIAIFALALLPKIALHVVLYHYGFVLAAPALILTIIVLLDWIPKWIDARGGCGAIARAGALGALLVLCVTYLNFTQDRYKSKTITVGFGADAFYADLRGQSINEMLEELPQDAATLAVVPQGAMINFLSARANPTPFVVLMPPEVVMFGEDRMVEAYQSHPPDVLLIVKSDLSEYGYKSFPQYAPKLAAWIDANYTLVRRGGGSDLPWTMWKLTRTDTALTTRAYDVTGIAASRRSDSGDGWRILGLIRDRITSPAWGTDGATVSLTFGFRTELEATTSDAAHEQIAKLISDLRSDPEADMTIDARFLHWKGPGPADLDSSVAAIVRSIQSLAPGHRMTALLTDFQAQQLLDASQPGQSASALAGPSLLARNGERARMDLPNSRHYVSGYEHRRNIDGSIEHLPQYMTAKFGLSLSVRPLLSEGAPARSVTVHARVANLMGMRQWTAPNPFDNGWLFTQSPVISKFEVDQTVKILAGHTLLISDIPTIDPPRAAGDYPAEPLIMLIKANLIRDN